MLRTGPYPIPIPESQGTVSCLLPFHLLPTVCSREAPLCCLHDHVAVALYVLCNCDHVSGDIMLLKTDICLHSLRQFILQLYSYFTLEILISNSIPL